MEHTTRARSGLKPEGRVCVPSFHRCLAVFFFIAATFGIGGSRAVACSLQAEAVEEQLERELATDLQPEVLTAQETGLQVEAARPDDAAGTTSATDAAEKEAIHATAKAERALLSDLHLKLELHSGSELESYARQLILDHPLVGLDALLLRAGSELPPGVTKAVTARRKSMREEARLLMRVDVASTDPSQSVWEERLRVLFDGRELDPDLHCALFSVVAHLDFYEFSEDVASGLGNGGSAQLRHAARKSLFSLYRIWFDGAAHLDDYRQELVDGVPPQAVNDHLAQAQVRTDESTLRLIASRPDLCGEALSDPSPEVREAAAKSLLESVGQTLISGGDARRMLFDGFPAEPDAAAFRARLDALLELCASEPASGDGVSRLRAILCSLDADRDILWSVLHGFARLRWDESVNATGEESLTYGVTKTAELFARLVDRERLLDADLLRQGLADLRSISERARPEISAPARKAVFFLLREYGGNLEVRRAAASSAAVVLSPNDVDALVDLFESVSDAPLVRDELLRTIGKLTSRLQPTSEPARRVLALLVEHLDEPEVDLRRRALNVLVDPGIHELVMSAGDPLLVDALARRLTSETDHELWVADFKLLSGFPRPDLVDTVLGTAMFAELVTGNELDRVTGILAELAGSDPR
ncbi:MAG: hypothetical protein ACI835_005491, partial [Planctomycetota bacterium]